MIDDQLRQKWETPTKSLPVIFIGAGGIIRNAHIPSYKKLNLNLQGVYDVNMETAKSLANDFDIPKVYNSIDETINNDGIVFDIAVPADKLLSIVKKLPNNSYALLQKPMGSNLRDAKEILNVCRENNITAALNFQLRFSPMMLCLKDAINKGILGKVIDIDFHYSYFVLISFFPCI